jgi:hypothetical protein
MMGHGAPPFSALNPRRSALVVLSYSCAATSIQVYLVRGLKCPDPRSKRKHSTP